MLDVRITGYVVPLAEQPQASLTPVIAVENVADESALITGLIRIYRESTGLLIYDSRLAVTQLAHHTSANIAALTPFDPPAPADDDYFVKADLVATSYLPGPPLPVTLGAWHFDIKTPPMGDAPAGHHGTHQLGGSDPIDVTDLAGLLADCQTPCTHAATHQNGGGDEISVAALSGLLADEQTPLPHYHAKHLGVFYETDFLGGSTYASHMTSPWSSHRISLGTFAPTSGVSDHPGIYSFSSSTTANSGVRSRLAETAILLAGSETTELILRPQTLALTTIRFGFHDATSSVDAVDGCYLEMTTPGTLVGKTASNSARSTTGTNYTLVTNTWYRLRIALNSDATRVDFYLYAEDGTLLWTDFLTTNIPTAAARVTGHSIIATNSGTSALLLAHVDYMNMAINRILVR